MTQWLRSRIGSILGLFAALLMYLLIAGCGNTYILYEGPERPKDEIAIVSTAGYGFWEQIFIAKINGKDVVSADRVPASTVKLQPGRYRFTIDYTRGIGFATRRSTRFISFDVEPGREYRIEVNQPFMWAEDKNAGQVVAGVKPN